MKIRIFDLHNDVITCLSRGKFNKYLLNAWKCGVEVIVLSIWTTEMQDPLEKIKCFKQVIDEIKTPIKLLLHIEDAWFVNENNVDEFIKCKPFSVGLTWNHDNALGGGANSNGMLTAEGEKIIEKLIKHDIKIDLAHLNKRCFYEVAMILSLHNQKLMCSHTCFNAVHENVRNLDSNQIQTIVNSDGIIGLTFVGSFLSANKQTSMIDVINHLKYFLQNFGEDNIAIGTDFFGTKDLPKNLDKYQDFRKLKKLLLANGMQEKTVDKIFYANAKNFLNSYV